ncbi:MAG: HD domain-containing protein, partial [Janthinobacterium lividum]
MTPPDISNGPGPTTMLPSTSLAKHILTTVTSTLTESLANHSIRTYLFARLLAQHQGAVADRDYDDQLLFAACTLHDIGLSPSGDDGPYRFEVEGADLAARLLTAQGLPADQVDAVWDAIALHTSPQLAERRSLLCQLTRDGVGIDFGRGAEITTKDQGASVHALYPRLALESALVDAVVDQARRVPGKAPRYSSADVFILE